MPQNLKLDVIDITDNVMPYLTKKSREIVSNQRMTTVYEGYGRVLFACYMHAILTRTIPLVMVRSGETNNGYDLLDETIYKKFAKLINVEVNAEHIIEGCFMRPFAMKLMANGGPNELKQKVLLGFYGFTDQETGKIILGDENLRGLYVKEGELGDFDIEKVSILSSDVWMTLMQRRTY